MKLDYAMPALQSNGRITMPINMVGDLYDIDYRVKHGDESGWRGDPTMWLEFNKDTKEFQVWGIDRSNREYIAASHHTLDHTLLIKLREGDPQKHDVIDRVLKVNQARRDAEKQKEDEQFAEIAGKVQHAINKEFHGRHNPVTVDRKPGD